MAKIKYSALVSEVRNKLNGSVLSKNRYGNYIRNKVTPVNPQTSFQQAARQRLGNLSASWRELTQAQRNSFINGAKNLPFTDIFGDIKYLSGQTMFVKLNGNLEKIGSPRIDSFPETVGFSELAISNPDFTVDGTSGPLTAAGFAVSPGTIPAGFAMVVYATPSIPAGRAFVKNQYRFLGVATVTAGAADIFSMLNSRFGEFTVGETVSVRCALVSTTTGQQSVAVELVATIAAA